MSIKNPFTVAAAVFAITFLFSASGIPARALASSALVFETATPQPPAPGTQAQALPPTPVPQRAETSQALQNAFQSLVNGNQNQALGLLIYDTFIDNIQYSKDGTTALLWIGLRDRETGEVIATEPGLAIARGLNKTALASPSSWSISLVLDSAAASQLSSLPAELLTQDVRERFLDLQSGASGEAGGTGPLTGYKLPWSAGLAKRVTNSIGHVYAVSGGLASCPTTCRYAYDFADGTMFPLLAAKGGTVRAYKTTCPNGGTDCTNYLILEDQSTSPTSYQLYYHMAYETVPARLRTIGAFVARGEYIGDTDDTGASTGHHLHFHVYQTPTGTNWSWGPSVDFLFDDVSDNSGHPRTCAEAREYSSLGSQCHSGGDWYTSGNTPANPPSGSFDLPADRALITTRSVRVQGAASDDIGISRIQVLANYDGSWKSLGDITPTGSGPYARDIDLCAAGVPDGPLAMTVRIFDREGSLAPGIPTRQVIKNFACGSVTPPTYSACTPAANQVALYAATDFHGACQKFDVNQAAGYPASALTGVGNDAAASVQVGSSVRAVLLDLSEDVGAARLAGRAETFEASDASLADNRIGPNHVSGLWVLPRTLTPDEPFLKPVGSRLSETFSPTSLDSLVLAWDGGAGATAFDASLVGPGTNLSTTLTTNSLSVGTLAAGSYTFTVKAKAGTLTNSSSKTFSVAQASFPAASVQSAPFSDDVEAGPGAWVATGLWRRASVTVGERPATQAWVYNDGTDYSDPTWRAGDLTSPPLSIPSGGPYYLRFAYFKDTEDGGPYWDQRRVQVSENGGAFKDLLRLSDDKQVGPIWLNSGPISLAAYAGKTIRLRFHFDTISDDYNTGKGWMVDNISVTTQAPNATCADTDSTPAAAGSIALGGSLSAVICPERDVDYYKVTATAGQAVVVDIDAKQLTPASSLDSYVSLLDADQTSPVVENDDETPGVIQDSWLPYIFPRSGAYYIKVKAWDYPGAGSPEHKYTISLRQNLPVTPQSVRIDYPTSADHVPTIPFRVAVSSADFDGGPVAQVDFYWHGPNWSQSWVKLGSDTNPSDGWSFPVTPAAYGDIRGSALYVQATSRTGGVKGTVLWDLVPDPSLPISELEPLPAQINSTVFLLNWSASDGQNDIDHFDLEYRQDSGNGMGDPQTLTVPGSARTTWFFGAGGSSYQFRLRAVDQAGNIEPWSDLPEASTTLGKTCTPDAKEIQGQNQSSAVVLSRTAYSPVFNFCDASRTGVDDTDWVTLDGKAGETLLILILPAGGGSAFSARLSGGPITTPLSWQSGGYEQSLAIKFVVPATARYYLEIKPLLSGMYGTDMKYETWYGPGSWIYLPVIPKQ